MTISNTVLAQSDFGSFWTLIANSGPIALAVLLILVFFSIFSWTIIFKKVRTYNRVEQESIEFHEEFRKRNSLSEISQQCDRYPMSPLAGIFRRGYEELTHRVQALENNGTGSEVDQREAILRSMHGLQRTLQKASMAEMMTLEQSLSWLATTGAVTPFIGLFGTVVGIINAFQGLGTGAATTIQAVAPGISEALVATAAGLFAAIPAVIGYNHLINRLRYLGAEMDDFSAEFLNLIERSFT